MPRQGGPSALAFRGHRVPRGQALRRHWKAVCPRPVPSAGQHPVALACPTRTLWPRTAFVLGGRGQVAHASCAHAAQRLERSLTMSSPHDPQSSQGSFMDRLRSHLNLLAFVASIFTAFAEVTYFRTRFGER